MPASVRRVFKTKWFHKAARKAGIVGAELCRAVRELARGQGVDLGGNVWKKRLDGNRRRAIVLGRIEQAWVFVFLSAKCDRDDIDERELRVFRQLAVDFGHRTDGDLATLIALDEFVEICNG
ncbi:type II toxin-antitoxin system RelE/ParE family toxin [Burkholderia multivorans]|uniref:type II toxin-antitoxin system RelE/ParE family toxin n=1 Tax=Burkholderia multivorans TaxID=87883 RepID=UPI000D000B13|nr:type II toxin-antitoxin system RelE/ParE family toxin [Burkholderia multivorans]MDN8003794.1 type II toxin-antitoxin system RelE/ParE family toxin [Burkholderia multivorans]PRH08463.1 addiction module toxin RelE [Burkholderia multivorans]PRH27771.1 addiction module toxin RelE [Burkholderia multivorans]